MLCTRLLLLLLLLLLQLQVEPVEGELDITVTNSTGNNLLPPATQTAAAAAAPGATASSTATGLPTSDDTVVPLLPIPASKTVNFAPGVTGSPFRSNSHTGQQQQQLDSPINSSSNPARGVVPLTDGAVQELDKQYKAADAAYNNRPGLGSPRSAYTVGRPAQRYVPTQLPRAGSASSSGSSSPRRHRVPSPKAAAVGLSSPVLPSKAVAPYAPAPAAGVAAMLPPRQSSAQASVAAPAPVYTPGSTAAAAAGDVSGLQLLSRNHSSSSNGDDRRAVADNPAHPVFSAHQTRKPSAQAATAAASAAAPHSMHGVDSIHTTESAGMVEHKKQKKGFFAMLKSKTVKGRQ